MLLLRCQGLHLALHLRSLLFRTMFTGLSTLRAKEKKQAPVSEKALQLQAYLAQQYGGAAPGGSGEQPVKKKKKKKRDGAAAGALRIHDQDVTGFAAVRQGPEARGPAEEEEDEGGVPQ